MLLLSFSQISRTQLTLALISFFALTSQNVCATISTDYGTNALRRYSPEGHIMTEPYYYSNQTHAFTQDYCDKRKAKKDAKKSEKKSRKQRLQENARKKTAANNSKNRTENITREDITIEEQYEARQK